MPSLMKHSAFGRTCAPLTPAKPLVSPTFRAVLSIETVFQFRKWPAAPGDEEPFEHPLPMGFPPINPYPRHYPGDWTCLERRRQWRTRGRSRPSTSFRFRAS